MTQGYIFACKKHFLPELKRMRKANIFMAYGNPPYSGRCDIRSGPRNGKCGQPAYKELYWDKNAEKTIQRWEEMEQCKHTWKPYRPRTEFFFKKETMKRCTKCKVQTGEVND